MELFKPSVSRKSIPTTTMERTHLFLGTLNGKIIRIHMLDKDEPLSGILAT